MGNTMPDDGDGKTNEYCKAVSRLFEIVENYHLTENDLIEIVEMGSELFLQKQFKKSVKEGD